MNVIMQSMLSSLHPYRDIGLREEDRREVAYVYFHKNYMAGRPCLRLQITAVVRATQS